MRYIECSAIEKDLEERYNYYRTESEIKLGDLVAIDDTLQTAAIIAKYALEQIQKAPTADVVEVRHGERLPTNIPSYFGDVIYECSLCKAKDGEHSSILGNYCWRCGAKMDGERKNDDKEIQDNIQNAAEVRDG